MPNTPFRTAQTTAILTAILLLAAPASAQQDVDWDAVDITVLGSDVGLSSGAICRQEAAPAEDDDIRTLVSRLSLEQYKATLDGLTQFSHRRQGTQRNRHAIDWIEAQL